MEKPSLGEFEIQNLIIRITSEKPTKRPLSSLKFCSPLQVIPEISSSSSWHLFHGSRNGAAPTKLIQENFFQEQLVSVVRVVLWCSCTQTIWCPCQNCRKAFPYYQGRLKKPEAVVQQDVKYILKRDPILGSWWKMPLLEAVLYPGKHGLGFLGGPARALWIHWT